MSLQPRELLTALCAQQSLSGSDLARRLGVTRAAVWKQIEALRALGAPIEAARGRGYRLSAALELIDAKRIRGALEPALRHRVGALDVHWQIDSTSSALLRAAADGAPDLSVCLAETQSAGRGRHGRRWQSPLAGNIYFSLLRRFACGMGALSGLSLAAGVALIEALADCGVERAGLKWPNDVVVDGRKLAGILVELGGEFLGPCCAVIGIGVNVRVPASVTIDQPHTDLARLCATTPSRNALIGHLITRLVAVLDRFASGGFEALQADFARYDVLAGRSVRVHSADAAQVGIADGVDARGALRVRHGDRVACYDSAEVSVRGI